MSLTTPPSAAAPDALDGAELTPGRFRELAAAIEAEVGRLIVGQHELLRDTLLALLAGGHVLLEGVPGLGKTALVRALGDVLDLGFGRIQFTPDLMPADITGTTVIQEHAGRRDFVFHQGPVFTNLVLADEINRATPKTQSALLEAMQERTVSAGGATRPLPQPFFVMATQNPIELEGTYPLPEAQLDRFLLKLVVPFPGEDDLREIVRRTTGVALPQLHRVAGAADVLAMHDLARRVVAADHVVDWAVRLVTATHSDRSSVERVRRYVRYGSGPRGVQAMVLCGKVRALLEGRVNLAFDDLRAVALPALRHRLILAFEADAAGVGADELVAEVLEAVPADPVAG